MRLQACSLAETAYRARELFLGNSLAAVIVPQSMVTANCAYRLLTALIPWCIIPPVHHGWTRTYLSPLGCMYADQAGDLFLDRSYQVNRANRRAFGAG